jgi:hypothetical protein
MMVCYCKKYRVEPGTIATKAFQKHELKIHQISARIEFFTLSQYLSLFHKDH